MARVRSRSTTDRELTHRADHIRLVRVGARLDGTWSYNLDALDLQGQDGRTFRTQLFPRPERYELNGDVFEPASSMPIWVG